jgi:hypothetical protein
MSDAEKVLTLREGYLAMFAFLDEQARQDRPTSEFDLHLSSMSCLADGMPADPAAWSDWLAAVDRARSGQVDARLILRR